MPPGPRQISEDRDHPDDALAAVIAQTVDEEDEETLREIKKLNLLVELVVSITPSDVFRRSLLTWPRRRCSRPSPLAGGSEDSVG